MAVSVIITQRASLEVWGRATPLSKSRHKSGPVSPRPGKSHGVEPSMARAIPWLLFASDVLWGAAFSHPPWALDSTIPVNPRLLARGHTHARRHEDSGRHRFPRRARLHGKGGRWNSSSTLACVHLKDASAFSGNAATLAPTRDRAIDLPHGATPTVLPNRLRARDEWALGNEPPELFNPRALNTSQVSLPRR